jgi:hypothetical protein
MGIKPRSCWIETFSGQRNVGLARQCAAVPAAAKRSFCASRSINPNDSLPTEGIKASAAVSRLSFWREFDGLTNQSQSPGNSGRSEFKVQSSKKLRNLRHARKYRPEWQSMARATRK